jgi:YVTN family beta-propeller protein
MYSNNSNGSRDAPARGFAALWVVLVMGLGLMASLAAAAPFAYVTNGGSNTVSVIDTAANKVVATVPVGFEPAGVAVAPDGDVSREPMTNTNAYDPSDISDGLKMAPPIS